MLSCASPHCVSWSELDQCETNRLLLQLNLVSLPCIALRCMIARPLRCTEVIIRYGYSCKEWPLSGTIMKSFAEQSHSFALLQAVEGCLGRLALQHCNIADVSPLAALHQLHNLNLAGNQVQEVARIQGLVGSLPQLQTLDVRDNPLCQARSYRQATACYRTVLCCICVVQIFHLSYAQLAGHTHATQPLI